MLSLDDRHLDDIFDRRILRSDGNVLCLGFLLGLTLLFVLGVLELFGISGGRLEFHRTNFVVDEGNHSLHLHAIKELRNSLKAQCHQSSSMTTATYDNNKRAYSRGPLFLGRTTD